jgi:hypothetical protein
MLQFPVLTSVPNYRLQQSFFVIPSNLPGMDFMTLSMMSNHKVRTIATRHDHDGLDTSQVHYSLRDDGLVVRTQCNQTNDILALIPSSKLRGDLPPMLVDGHVHWLNLTTKIIEIRPVEKLWEQSSEHWMIDCSSGQYRVYRGCETLVDIRSPTWAMVSECFECLNSVDRARSTNLLITTSPIDSVQPASVRRLSVTLSRYDLSFFANAREELESRDFKDMVYDEDQCVGALFGLENLLVLRPKTHIWGASVPEAPIPRRVLIPNGVPERHLIDNHRFLIGMAVDAHSFTGPDELLYHTYDVDTELGCLIGNGSLTSMRLLAHLYAMTSCHRPDPLTGKTGAQAALCLLQSAGCRSIMRLKALHIDDDRWTSTQYPQINTAYQEILNRYYWNRHLREASASDKRDARRAAYLFPSNAAGPISPKDYDDSKHVTTHVPAEPGLATLPHSISSCNECLPRPMTLDHLLCNRPAPELPARSTLLCDSHNTMSDDIPLLDQRFSSLRADSSFRRDYLAHLDASAQFVRVIFQMTHEVAGENRIEALRKHYERCRVSYLNSLDILKKSLGPTTDPHEEVLDRFGQWPQITADVLLRYLASTSPIEIPPRWKKCLISLASLLLELQRSRRLLRFALDGLEDELSKELANEGCDGWHAEEFPDWLLIQVASFYLDPPISTDPAPHLRQVQGNFLIRRAQAKTAMEIMSPRSGENTVMQVNMGEGKSSVIIPIAAAALADGKQLVRVIVPKALTVQMFELLVARLGGLANRPIFYLPFSRTPEYYDRNGNALLSPQIRDLHKLMSQCMTERGILLVQPEHVVSLKLMSVEKQICAGNLTTTDPLLKHPKLICKYIKTALSFRSVGINDYVLVIVNSADYWIPDIGRQEKAHRSN